MIQTVLNDPEMAQTLQMQPPEMLGYAISMARYMQLLFSLSLVLAPLTLTSSIGLLLRKNWARLAFVGLMILGIVN